MKTSGQQSLLSVDRMNSRPGHAALPMKWVGTIENIHEQRKPDHLTLNQSLNLGWSGAAFLRGPLACGPMPLHRISKRIALLLRLLSLKACSADQEYVFSGASY